MFLKLFGRYAQLDRNSPRLLTIFFSVLGHLPLPNLIAIKFNSYARFFATNRNLSLRTTNNNIYPALNVLIVSHSKDFHILPYSLGAAKKHTRHHSLSVFSVIVPDRDFMACKKLIQSTSLDVNVLKESDLISSLEMSKLRNSLGERAGWVIQQLLKIRFVLSANTEATLVIDADTILLMDRVWIDQFGVQVLTPTWEYHKPYYVFLNLRGISPVNPKYTFVSHHMLLQKYILIEALSYAGLADDKLLVDDLLETRNGKDMSPFSIDYELYAQYIFSRYPEMINLERWGNLSLEELRVNKFAGYASVSIHSYNSNKAPQQILKDLY